MITVENLSFTYRKFEGKGVGRGKYALRQLHGTSQGAAVFLCARRGEDARGTRFARGILFVQ